MVGGNENQAGLEESQQDRGLDKFISSNQTFNTLIKKKKKYSGCQDNGSGKLYRANCSAKLLHALTSKGHRNMGGLNTSLPEGVPWFPRN